MNNPHNIRVLKYQPENKSEWNTFVRSAKNGHFMFQREYMEYHSDRFQDFSLLFYQNNTLIGLLPANITNSTVHSHQGLSFGGIIVNKDMRAALMLSLFSELHNFFHTNNINEFFYKRIPTIYCSIPSDEDRYALFRNSYIPWRCDLTTTIFLKHKIKYSDLRKTKINRAKKHAISISYSSDYTSFWTLLTNNMETKYGIMPTHTLNEIERLHSTFPDNIKLCVAMLEGQLIAGTVLFIEKQTVHTQYLATNDTGKQTGALDLLIDTMISNYSDAYEIFDFGNSNEENGMILNEGLIFQKEGFGGRGIIHEFFHWVDTSKSSCELH